jgi:MFS family permease
LSQDGRWILVGRTTRNLGYGLFGVLVGLYLEAAGYPATTIGLLFSLSLAGSALLSFLLAAYADRIGRRRSLLICTALMAGGGLAFAVGGDAGLLLAAALTGTINPTAAETGPFEAVEAAILPQTGAAALRNRMFGWYHATGGIAIAIGSLAAGLFDSGDLASSILRYRAGFLAYAGLALLSWLALSRLGAESELALPPTSPGPGLRRSRGIVARLSVLFALDSLGGGFVVQSLVVYWFSLRFGVGAGLLGPLFFGVNLLKAGSYVVAARLADRFGLVNTMVFTHLPSNVALILLPLMPSLELASACLLIRHALAQMDVPTRSSYLVAVVDPEERTAASGVTSVVRAAAHAVTPVLAGRALQMAALGVPFYLAGGLKILYDLGLYLGFRRLRTEEERLR